MVLKNGLLLDVYCEFALGRYESIPSLDTKDEQEKQNENNCRQNFKKINTKMW